MCCDVAYAEYKDVSEVINLFNNISWRIIANNKIVGADESNWITQEGYNESIIKVMAQAVADCITDKNEFAFKGEGDVITFAVEAKDYSAENWNAVVLWNYLHVLKWDYLNNKTRSKDEIFEDVRTRICDNYPTEGEVDLAEKLEKAISDIKEYDKELSLADEMQKFSTIYKNTKNKSFETIATNDIAITPVGEWEIEGNNIDGSSLTKSTFKVGANVRIVVLRNDAHTWKAPSAWFPPIHIKLNDDLYFINKYVCFYAIDWICNAMFYDNIESIYEGSYIRNEDIMRKIQDKITQLLDGLEMGMIGYAHCERGMIGYEHCERSAN